MYSVARVAHRHYNKDMKKRIFIAACAVIFLAGCSSPEVSSESYALNTLCSQEVTGQNAKTAADEVNRMLQDITNSMSVSEGSEVYAVNMAATQAIKVSEDTAFVIAAAKEMARETDGAFDATAGALTELWDITGNPRVPSPEEIDAALTLVDYNGISVNGTSVSLARSGMKIDLGGIAKGYAADEAVRIYAKYGIDNALLSLGGNIYAYGDREYRIGIRDPLGSAGDVAATITVAGTSVVTSGGYERYFESGGKIYHHILDPKTGYPADNGLLSVTVVCENSTKADALSTALFVMGLEKGMKYVQAEDDIEAVFIMQDRKIYITNGLKGNIEATDETYTIES